MNSHVIDSQLFKDLYGNKKIRKVFSDESLLKKWISVEVTLAQVQSELGIIPVEAYEEIKRKGKTELFDMNDIRKGISQTTHPLITFIRMYEKNCENDYGEYIHFGATTQDIMDTGLILQMKDGYDVISNQLIELITVLRKKTYEYKRVPMAGRTHGQHALPITFGYKLATWLSELERNKTRLEKSEQRVFVGQFGGAVGTLASLEGNGEAVRNRLLNILGLYVPDITWHTVRDNLVELVSIYGMISGAIGKMANEIKNLQRTEIAEVIEGSIEGTVGSSTMPHKQNPMICEYVIGLSKLVRNQMPSVYDTLVQEHERDMGLWLVEWEVFTEISIYVSKMIEQITSVISGMKVDTQRMRENIDMTGGLILSEKLMFFLSPYFGKQTAYKMVHEACEKANNNNVSLSEEILKNELVRERISEAKLREVLDPENYLGMSVAFVDKVLEGNQISK